ncbi:MAG TPA: DUF4395 domain-containing protein [Micromonosporaceae bacterium]|jgi:hypothetical protein|nr:DUF4395 domain-containing protein [Micromonosporaceae bacterium]
MLDPRGPRFSAWLTTAVLLAVLVLVAFSPVVAGLVVLAQAVVFAAGAASARRAPYGWIFRAVVAPRLGPPTELEPAAPVRFAQGVGFVFALVSAVSLLAGATAVGVVAASAALVAAFLNAAFGLCLACKVYPFVRLYVIRRPAQPATTEGAHP